MSKFQVVKDEQPLVLYSFLNINNPIVAFNVYRGVLMPPHLILDGGSAISLWMMGRLIQENKVLRVNEFRLEIFRQKNFSDKVSRLRCLYTFLGRSDALKASKLWGNSFKEEYLTDLGFAPEAKISKVDSNWITYSFPTGRLIDDSDTDWMNKYWSGVPYNDDPLWELLVEAPGLVYGTELRESAWKLIERHQPESLPFMELSRLASEVSSEVGVIVPIILKSDISEKKLQITYVCNMEDYNNQSLHLKLKGHNCATRIPIENLKIPDLRQFNKTIEVSALIEI